jgi:excisionase family DNA binding protein
VPAQPNANSPAFGTEKDRLLKVAEAAAYYHVSRVWIDAALTTNELRHVKLGPNTRRIWLSDLRKWLDKKTVKASPRASWLS